MTLREGIKQAVKDFGKKVLAEERLVNILSDFNAFENNHSYRIIVRHIVQHHCQKQFIPTRNLFLRKNLNDKDKQQVERAIYNIASVTGKTNDEVRDVVNAYLFALDFDFEENTSKSCSTQFVNETVIDRKPFVTLGLLLAIYISQLIYLNFFYNKWWMSVCVFCLLILNYAILAIEIYAFGIKKNISYKIDKNKTKRFYKWEIVKNYLPLIVALTSISTWLYPFLFLKESIVGFYNFLFGTYVLAYEGGVFVTAICFVGLSNCISAICLFSFFNKENKHYIVKIYKKSGYVFNSFKHVITSLILVIITTILPICIYISYIIVSDSIQEHAIQKQISVLDSINENNIMKTVDLSYKELKLGIPYYDCVRQIQKSKSMKWQGDSVYHKGYFSTTAFGKHAVVSTKTLNGMIYEIKLDLVGNDFNLDTITKIFEKKYGNTGYTKNRYYLEWMKENSRWYVLRSNFSPVKSLPSRRDCVENEEYWSEDDSVNDDWKIRFENGSITICSGYDSYEPSIHIIYRDKMLYEQHIAICHQIEQQRLIKEELERKTQRQKEIDDSLRSVKDKEKRRLIEKRKKQKEKEDFATDI